MAAAPIFSLVLKRTADVCRRHPLALAGLSVVATGPPLLGFAAVLAAAQLGWLGFELDPSDDRAIAATLIAWALLSAIQQGAATSGTLRVLRGEPFGFGAALGAGLRRSPAVLLAWLIMAVAVFAGLSVLIAPGLVALGALCLGVPATVEERVGATRALVRSLDLSRGSRGGLLGAVVVLSVVGWVAIWGSIASINELSESFGLAYPFLISLFAQLPAVGCAVAYAELRDRKEGRPTAELAKVFE